MEQDKSVTSRLAEFIADLKYEQLPNEVVTMAKLCIVDYLGSLIIGTVSAQGRTVAKMMEDLGGKPEASMAGNKNKIPALNAALANGTMAHSQETDDFHVENGLLAGHLGVVAIPPAIAAAELNKTSGKDVITAVVLGYESAVRISRCMGESHYRLWQSTGTIGTFAAATSAGKILKLGIREMVWALGLAGTQAAGLMHSVGSFAKPFHAGKACQNGLMSALLAQRGFVGPDAILEGKRGYCAATSADFDLKEITKGLGDSFAISKNSFKKYPCGVYDTVDIAVKLFSEVDINVQEIEKIVLGTNTMWARTQSNPNPENITAAKISTQYCVATAILRGDLTVDDFSPERLNDPQVRKLMDKIELEVDPEVDVLNNSEHYAIRITVLMKDGQRYSDFLKDHKGFYQNPLTAEEIEEKFRKLARKVVEGKRVSRILEHVKNLEKLENLSELCEELR